jgi:Zn-dependent protease
VSWTLGKVFGIPVKLHFTMVLLPFLTSGWMAINTILGFFTWIMLLVLLFGSVLLHELGHALTARRYGIYTQDIVLTPLGGMARVVSMPENPRQEIAIAIAGPLVSISLAGLAFIISFSLVFLPFFPKVVYDAVYALFFTNLMLALFNLIPALPMDGGRVLRGVLALKRDHLSATRIAARLGRILAVIGGVYGLLQANPIFVLIAIFIYYSAGVEVRVAEMRAYQERARSAGEEYSAPFPFGGMPRSRVWRWDSRSGAREYGASSVDADRASNQEKTKNGGWSTENERSDSDVVVVTGKAEIIDRKDPH